jgi:phage terminase small subunit
MNIMEKFIDTEKLIAEIERRMSENCELAEKAKAFGHRAVEDNDILALIEQLQQEQPAKWSKEDEVMLNMIEYRLKDRDNIKAQHGYQDDYTLPSPTKWLETRCSQPHWKPSNEQMDALKEAAEYNFYAGKGATLRLLYNDLQKLF